MKENIEKIKDLKAVYSGAIEAGELSIANIIKSGIDLIEKLQKENEELKNRWDKDTHKLQNDLDIANAERIELKEENEGLKYKYDKALSDLVKLQKENEELKHKYDTFVKMSSEVIKNSVPVQKVKDKIEELNKYYKKEIYPERFNWADVNITEYYDGMIEILQDLLEEKGE